MLCLSSWPVFPALFVPSPRPRRSRTRGAPAVPPPLPREQTRRGGRVPASQGPCCRARWLPAQRPPSLGSVAPHFRCFSGLFELLHLGSSEGFLLPSLSLELSPCASFLSYLLGELPSSAPGVTDRFVTPVCRHLKEWFSPVAPSLGSRCPILWLPPQPLVPDAQERSGCGLCKGQGGAGTGH